MIECVPNFSEGRNLQKVSSLESTIAGIAGIAVLHRTSDADHNRSVITFAGSPQAVLDAAVSAAAKAVELIDLNTHRGVHPRLGALDVLPFVPLGDSTLADCIQLAHRAGQRIWDELSVPIYFYEAAALRPDRVKLENVRRGEFEGIRDAVLLDETCQPDLGGPFLHPTAGAVIVGARKILIAYNINLNTPDLAVAQQIARQIRESNGGFPGVKAIGVSLQSRGLAQVSMNLTDYEATPLHVVYMEVERLASMRGVAIEESELVGLLPRAPVERAAAAFLKLRVFDTDRVIENRLERLRPGS